MSSSSSKARRTNDDLDRGVRSVLKRFETSRGVQRMAIALVGSFALFAALNPRVFMSTLNMQNIMVAAPEVGILALAMSLAMLTGGVDLSLVAIANLSAIAISTTTIALGWKQAGPGQLLALVGLGLAVGLACGAINGILIGGVGVTPILATLATMQIFNGLGVVWTEGKTLYGAPEGLTSLGRVAVGTIPLTFILFLVVALLMGALLARSVFGQQLRLQGANRVAARFSGIRGPHLLMRSYLLSGLLGGLAGVFFLLRNPTASADYGLSYVLLVIVISVLGGTNPNGGFASTLGVVLATVTLQVIGSGFTALRMSPYQYSIAQGILLIMVMVIDFLSSNSQMFRLRRGKQAN